MWHTSAFGFAVSACSTRTLNGRHTPSRMRSNTVAGSAVSSSCVPGVVPRRLLRARLAVVSRLRRRVRERHVVVRVAQQRRHQFLLPRRRLVQPSRACPPRIFSDRWRATRWAAARRPGPPRVSAVMNRRNSALCRVRLTSSTQYRCSVGRAPKRRHRAREKFGASSPSSSASARHSACTHRHSRSCAVSWYPAMTSMSARPARWWCVRRSVDSWSESPGRERARRSSVVWSSRWIAAISSSASW